MDRMMSRRSSSDAVSPSSSRNASPRKPPASRQAVADEAGGGGGGTRGLWPAASKKSGGTLADHLGNDRLSDRHNSAVDDEGLRPSKENRPVGGSMRYLGKLRFPRSGGKQEPRVSVDEAALRTIGVSESEPPIRMPPIPRHTRGSPQYESWSVEGMLLTAAASPPAAVEASAATMKRTSSYRFAPRTQWAMSPGRTSGDGIGSRSFSSLRPASPGKARAGVGNFISSLGMDLFRRKSPSSSPLAAPPVMASWTPAAAAEMGHQYRMVRNHLIQWRYLNARSDAVNHVRWLHAQNTLLSGWVGMSKLQALVVQKKVQLARKKLRFKIQSIVSCQMKELEDWGDIERQHSNALTSTKDCLQSAVCKVPLMEGAKCTPQAISIELRRAADLVMTVNTAIDMFTATAQNTVPILLELAQVITREKSLLQECFELFGMVGSLQIQEQSLKCHLVQLNSLKQQQQQLIA